MFSDQYRIGHFRSWSLCEMIPIHLATIYIIKKNIMLSALRNFFQMSFIFPLWLGINCSWEQRKHLLGIQERWEFQTWASSCQYSVKALWLVLYPVTVIPIFISMHLIRNVPTFSNIVLSFSLNHKVIIQWDNMQYTII